MAVFCVLIISTLAAQIYSQGSTSLAPATRGQATVGSSLSVYDIKSYNKMLVLGSHLSDERKFRVNLAMNALEKGTFTTIVMSGGCGAHGTATTNCEGEDMKNILNQKLDQLFNAGPQPFTRPQIIVEGTSQSTSGNYENSKKYFSTSDKVLVISSSENAKAVAYCLSYKDKIASSTYIMGMASYPDWNNEKCVKFPESCFESTPYDYSGGAYSGMVQGCRATSGGSPGSVPYTPPTQNLGSYSPTAPPSSGLTTFDNEIDEVWSSISPIIGGKGAGKIWDGSTWVEKKVIPPPVVGLSPTASQGTVNTVYGDLVGPSFWCTGTEGLPNPVYQNRIDTLAWNSNSKTYKQLAIEVGNAKKVDPALLALHMVLESSIGKDNPCTDSQGIQKSFLTGCGWPGTCAGSKGTDKYCSCSGSSVISDQAQLECTASSTYISNGKIRETGYYAPCNEFSNDPDKRWKCLLCIYQGSYDKKIGGTTTSFIPDYTCKYAEDFKQSYCRWRDYFVKEGTYSNAPAILTTPVVNAPVNFPEGMASVGNNMPIPQQSLNSFSFVVIGDGYSGGQYKVREKIFGLIPTLNPKPDFVIAVGDMSCVNGGCGDYPKPLPDSYTLWNNLVFQPVNTYLINNQIGFYPSIGNHDTIEYSWAWKKYVANSNVQGEYNSPENYGFGHGNSYFISFNDLINSDKSSVANWLGQEISNAKSKGYQNIFAFAHVSFDSAAKENIGGGSSQCNAFGPVIKDNVKIFFSGDAHVFDYRIIPSTHNGNNKINCQGITQIISGIAGGSVREHENGGATRNGILLVTVYGSSVNIQKYDLIDNSLVQTDFDQRWTQGVSSNILTIN
jgi:hypothetical protein